MLLFINKDVRLSYSNRKCNFSTNESILTIRGIFNINNEHDSGNSILSS